MRKIIAFLILGLSCSAVIVAVYVSDSYFRLDLLERIELKTLDYRFMVRGVRKPDDRIVILGIDKEALDKIKDPMIFWRPHFARVIRSVAQGGARAMGLDFVFPIPITKKVDGKDYDKIMAMALKEADCVILTKTFRLDKERNGYVVDQPIARLRFAASPNYTGFANLTSDPDNVVRRQNLMISDYKGRGHLSFGLAIFSRYLGILGREEIRYGREGVQLGDRVIPVNKYGEMLTNFAGPSGTFNHISFYEAWTVAGEWPEEKAREYFETNFGGKIVLIGTTNILHQDFKPTPFFASKDYFEVRSTYGIEIWGNMINTIMQEKYIFQLPVWMVSMIILFMGMVVSYASLRLSLARSLIFVAFLGAVYVVVCVMMFIRSGVWVNIVAPSVTIPLTYAVVFTYRYTIENKQRGMVKHLFQHYLHPSVVNELLKDPDSLKLGGIKKELTIYFSDIAGFTTISEGVEAEELVELINYYLTEMSDIIVKYEGTIDKYEGDAIMAFFGAPLDMENHALLACYAAMESQKRLLEMRKALADRGWPEIEARVGLNTGLVVVGNMGGENRFDYTVLGDDVNLASRLEGANKMYSTNLMVGQRTYELVKDEIVTRELDSIRVKGKTRPVTVYELIARKGETGEGVAELLQCFSRGLAAYKDQEWVKALGHFTDASKVDQDDGPSQLYITRCKGYIKSPPPEGWDGVYEMTTK